MKNVIVYIDYENLHYNLIADYTNIFELSLFENVKQYLKSLDYNIISIVAYCNFDIDDMYNSYHQTKLHQLGIQTVHTSNNGKSDADIQISIDIFEQIINTNMIDGVVLISNDKDMSSLLRTIRKHKEFVLLITTKKDLDRILIESSSDHKYLEDILSEIHVEDSSPQLTDDIYKNLNNFIQSQFILKSNHPLISLDKHLENLTKYYKTFEYEIVRNFYVLEKQGLLLTHKYFYHKDFIGIISDKYKDYKIDGKPLNFQTNYFEEYLKRVYDKYNKNNFKK